MSDDKVNQSVVLSSLTDLQTDADQEVADVFQLLELVTLFDGPLSDYIATTSFVLQNPDIFHQDQPGEVHDVTLYKYMEMREQLSRILEELNTDDRKLFIQELIPQYMARELWDIINLMRANDLCLGVPAGKSLFHQPVYGVTLPGHIWSPSDAEKDLHQYWERIGNVVSVYELLYMLYYQEEQSAEGLKSKIPFNRDEAISELEGMRRLYRGFSGESIKESGPSILASVLLGDSAYLAELLLRIDRGTVDYLDSGFLKFCEELRQERIKDKATERNMSFRHKDQQ